MPAANSLGAARVTLLVVAGVLLAAAPLGAQVTVVLAGQTYELTDVVVSPDNGAIKTTPMGDGSSP